MGCASSKQQKRCRHCQNPYSPIPRSYSMHVHHPPQAKGDSYHLVALTSSTLGSLKLDSVLNANPNPNPHTHDDDKSKIFIANGNHRDTDFSLGLIEAKTWSTMIDEKIPKLAPKTPIRTPPGEPETINAWELMEGLEDTSPFRSPIHIRSFSFDVVRDPKPAPEPAPDRPKSRFQQSSNGLNSPPKQPMWLQLESNPEPALAEFDPEIISSFRKSLEKLENCDDRSQDDSVFGDNDDDDDTCKSNPRKEKLILYFTSLRGVRKTYEDCCHVRVILKSLGVRVDERDVSMHSGFKEELRVLLKDGFSAGGLPRVFIADKYIGGADEIRRLNEEGQLEKLLDGCERIEDFSGDLNGVACEACGDIRFVPCETCSGSCKIYYEEGEEDEDHYNGNEEENGEDYGFQRCPDCNENGLIRCPICCY